MSKCLNVHNKTYKTYLTENNSCQIRKKIITKPIWFCDTLYFTIYLHYI